MSEITVFQGNINESISLIIDKLIQIESKLSKPLPELPTTEPDYMTRQQARAFLHCSNSTLFNYQAEGKLPYHKLKRKVFFKKADLERLLRRVEL